MGDVFRRRLTLVIAILSLTTPDFHLCASPSTVAEEAEQAFQIGDFDRVESLLSQSENSPTLRELRIKALQNRGVQRFFSADIKGSLLDFDAVIALDPELAPYHWQRGLCCYYAEEFEKGREQFVLHQQVNPNDVENAVWHFLCVVRARGGSVEKARATMLPVSGDTRVPMAQIYDLFAGRGSEAAVLAAAEKEIDGAGDTRRNQLCYAHLYLGLYYEACGERESSEEHIRLAAESYSMDHYMGKTAQVHAKLRAREKGASQTPPSK